ncbi:hypothetical protein [Spirochaeta cellobiosiphila]|uniref:hypothetical protein n=1 Tax=Spirochaeta cellobiosiphila TaxID=504483 RepID=UPI00048D657A|nr:hypothetical protein [Spirochaeta cellobiosiphila]
MLDILLVIGIFIIAIEQLFIIVLYRPKKADKVIVKEPTQQPLVVVNVTSGSGEPSVNTTAPSIPVEKEETQGEPSQPASSEAPPKPPPQPEPKPVYSEPALPKDPDPLPTQEPPFNPNIVKCPECGKENSIFRDKCFNCNTKLPRS